MVKKKSLLFCVALFSLFIFLTANKANAICIYKTRSGETLGANSIQEVPRIYRKDARCDSELSNNSISDPKDLNLEGREGNIEMTTNFGNLKLKWSKEIAELLQRNPQKVVSNSMATLSRVINSTQFKEKLANMNLSWDVVFFGKDIPYQQIPSYLITNCHPGWMLPPANIYISVERAYRGCSGIGGAGNIGDTELEKVILHEIGHVVENQLLANKVTRDLVRSEGFATWFLMFASRYSSLVNREEVVGYYKNHAKESFQKSMKGFYFQGSLQDYARSSMYFLAIEEKQGLSGVLEVYNQMMSKSDGDFLKIVADLLNTSKDYLDQKVYEIVFNG